MLNLLFGPRNPWHIFPTTRNVQHTGPKPKHPNQWNYW